MAPEGDQVGPAISFRHFDRLLLAAAGDHTLVVRGEGYRTSSIEKTSQDDRSRGISLPDAHSSLARRERNQPSVGGNIGSRKFVDAVQKSLGASGRATNGNFCP